MYSNIYATANNLNRIDPSVGGYCRLYFTPKQHIDVWPVIHPLSGVAEEIPTLHTGKVWYSLENMPANAIYKEEEQESNAGPWYRMSVVAPLADDSSNNSLKALAHRYHEMVVIIEEQNGMVRMIGTADAGAKLVQSYNSSDEDGTRQRILTFNWEHPQPAVLVTDNLLPDTDPVVNSSFMLVEEFRVDAVGAPMTSADTTYTNASLSSSSKPIVFADGIRIPYISGSGRYLSYNFGTKTITYNGGVSPDEIIAIYA